MFRAGANGNDPVTASSIWGDEVVERWRLLQIGWSLALASDRSLSGPLFENYRGAFRAHLCARGYHICYVSVTFGLGLGLVLGHICMCGLWTGTSITMCSWS